MGSTGMTRKTKGPVKKLTARNYTSKNNVANAFYEKCHGKPCFRFKYDANGTQEVRPARRGGVGDCACGGARGGGQRAPARRRPASRAWPTRAPLPQSMEPCMTDEEYVEDEDKNISHATSEDAAMDNYRKARLLVDKVEVRRQSCRAQRLPCSLPLVPATPPTRARHRHPLAGRPTRCRAPPPNADPTDPTPTPTRHPPRPAPCSARARPGRRISRPSRSAPLWSPCPPRTRPPPRAR